MSDTNGQEICSGKCSTKFTNALPCVVHVYYMKHLNQLDEHKI